MTPRKALGKNDNHFRLIITKISTKINIQSHELKIEHYTFIVLLIQDADT